MIRGNLLFGQSGGPTSVINSSAAGVFLEALAHPEIIEKVYGAHHGIVGVLNEDFFDMGEEKPEELRLMKYTPSSILGSCRYKLTKEEDFEKIYAVFQKYNIRYFFYNGGNDSMDTCSKISRFLKEKNYECRVVGVPKTIDNDLALTDHCPGFGSAAKFIATSTMEIYQDARVYNTRQVTIIEIMGRHAGWLAAASALANYKGSGPDLIYLPERSFEIDRMMADTERILKERNNVIIAISEGIADKNGRFISELQGAGITDSFGHKQLGGSAVILSREVEQKLGCKVRAVEFSLMQRSAAHIASATDVEESFLAGRSAVNAALEDRTDIMIGFKRPATGPYRTEIAEFPLSEVANTEKKVPQEWINAEGNQIMPAFVNYALPLIQGRPDLVTDESLPRFAKLKFVQAGRP